MFRNIAIGVSVTVTALPGQGKNTFVLVILAFRRKNFVLRKKISFLKRCSFSGCIILLSSKKASANDKMALQIKFHHKLRLIFCVIRKFVSVCVLNGFKKCRSYKFDLNVKKTISVRRPKRDTRTLKNGLIANFKKESDFFTA